MIDVVALGELLIDFAAKSTDAAGYPTMAANPGGAPGNFLAALNAYGRKTAFLGKVGNDTFGHLLLGTLSRAGIETKGILVDDHFFTTLAFVTFDDTGDRSFAFARKPGADTQLTWEEALKMVGLEDRIHFLPNQMSGGQCQRVAIARAIVTNPALLLADEPTGALDSKSGKQVMEIFDSLSAKGMTILMITHDSDVAKWAKKTYHILDGELFTTLEEGGASHEA